MKVKIRDGECYLDRQVLVFFNDQKIPDDIDETKFCIVIVKRRKKTAATPHKRRIK